MPSQPAAIPESITCEIPARLRAFGEALAPIAPHLRKTLTRRPDPSGHEFEALPDLSLHFGILEHAFPQLSNLIAGPTSRFLADQTAGPEDAYRAAGRLEQACSVFEDGYLTVKASDAGPATRTARRLLLDVYEHHILSLADWVDECIHVITQPLDTIKARDLPLASEMTLTITLNLTSPPQMAAIRRLVRRLQRRYENLAVPEPAHCTPLPPQWHNPTQPPPSIWNSIGAIALGLGLAKGVFKRGAVIVRH